MKKYPCQKPSAARIAIEPQRKLLRTHRKQVKDFSGGVEINMIVLNLILDVLLYLIPI